jgi:hypothetical protein
MGCQYICCTFTNALPGLTRCRFLIARLKADAMKTVLTPAALDESLESHTVDLDEVYKTSLTRINDLKPRILLETAQNLIVWAVLSTRSLDLEEIGHALATDSKRKKFNKADVPSVDAILSLTQGLVVYQGESKKVRPVHETAHKVLLNYVSKIERFKLGGPHQYLASGCFTYLSFDDFEGGFCQTDDEFERRLGSYQLYDYAAHNWGHHAREALTVCQEVIDFLLCEMKVEAASQALMAIGSWRSGYSQKFPRQMTGLHLAAYFGIQEAVKFLLGHDKRPDLTDSYGRTPLSWAAANGHEAVVQLLLGEGADVNAQGGRFGNALQAASRGGHEKVVELLLGKGADVNAQGGRFGNALLAASEEGHEKVVELLLGKGADVNAEGGYLGNALLAASEEGHEKVVELLLGKGADVNAQGGYLGNALQAALHGGHEKVVELLLGKGAARWLWLPRQRAADSITRRRREGG